jgi:hypothetical protein
MTATHFTAWLVNDTSCLDQPCMDVTVLEDDLIGEDPEDRGAWSSNGNTHFYAVTTVDARDGDDADGVTQAEELLRAAGWRTVGQWDVTTSAYVVTVERD